MGIAIISGVISSLETRWSAPLNTLNHHTTSSGTSTPITSYMMGASDDVLPSKFLATVGRKESAKKLRKFFIESFGELADLLEVSDGGNVKAVTDSDVVLLWCVLAYYIDVQHVENVYSCKPQLAETILTEEGMREAIHGKLVVSIMAGVTINQLSGWLDPSVKIIRAMPNTPSKASPCLLSIGLTSFISIRRYVKV